MTPAQCSAILAALRAGETLTPLVALQRFNCFRLGARIYELRQRGHAIESENRAIASGKRVAHYFLRQLELAA